MPTIFIVFGFIFRFFSDDHLPIHVHVVKDGHEAKYNVEPKVELVPWIQKTRNHIDREYYRREC